MAGVATFGGWETGDAEEIFSTSGTFSVQSTTVRTGSSALRVNPTTTGTGFHAVRGHSAAGAHAGFVVATLWQRVYFRYATKPSANSEVVLDFHNATAVKGEVRLDSAGNLSFYDSTATIQGSAGSTVLLANTWYRIEAMCGTGASGVSWEVKIDGVSEISGAGANTTTTNHDRVRYGKATNRNGNTVDFFYDDYQVNDTGYPGAGQCEVMQPDSDGTYTAWTVGAGAGADYLQVDELPNDGATTYLVSTLVSGDASTVGLESCATAGVSGTINAIKHVITYNRDGAANGAFAIRYRTAGIDHDTGNISSASAINTNNVLAALNPDTAVAWTVSELDGIELGVVEKSTVNKSRWTSGAMMVDFVTASSQRFVLH